MKTNLFSLMLSFLLGMLLLGILEKFYIKGDKKKLLMIIVIALILLFLLHVFGL